MTSPELRRVARAAEKAASALQARNDAIITASKNGEKIRAIAAAAGLSAARVHQIIHGR